MAQRKSDDEKPRRDYGSGSVYRNKHGVWVGTIEAGWTKSGKRRRITVKGKSEAEAKRRLRDKRLELDKGNAPAGRTTVKKWAEEWLELTQRDLRPKTWATNASAVRLWVIPTIGHRRLDALSPTDVRSVGAAIRKAGRSSSTALRAHVVLTTMLRAAVQDGHHVPPSCLAVKAPAKAVSDRDAMPVSHALAVLRVASGLDHGTRWAAALLQGMRQAECLGLTWDCVDLDNRLLDVSWQLQALPYNVPRDRSSGFRVPDGYEARHLEGRHHLVRPKSKAGRRVIPLVPWIADALEKWRQVAPPSPHGLVWPATDGGPCDDKEDSEEWRALQCTAEVGHEAGRWYDGHEARHTTATLLMEAGVPETVIIAIIGHSSIVSTQAYLHASQETARAAMAQVAARLQLES